MAIGVKAVFNYSAVTSTTTAWTVTASTSIAVGDVLVLSTAMRGSASYSISAITDNGNNAWSRAVEHSSAGYQSGIWYAPVTSTTSNFQIAIKLIARSVTARAAHLLVLTGVNLDSPFDAATGASLQLVSSSATTATLSTSAATGFADEFLVVSAHQNNIASATMNADSAWTARGDVIAVVGGVNSEKFLWTRQVGATGIYVFSASLSNGGSPRSRFVNIAGFRPSASVSGTATLGFDSTATLEGAVDTSGLASTSFATASTLSAPVSANASSSLALQPSGGLQAVAAANGIAALALVGSAELRAGGALDAMAAAIMAPQAVLSGKGVLAAATTFGFDNQASGTASGSSLVSMATSLASNLGGGWDKRLFRRLLAQHRSRLQSQVRELSADPQLDVEHWRQAAALDEQLKAAAMAPARQLWRLRAQVQALAEIDRNLADLGTALEAARDERDAEALLLLAA